MLLFLSKLLPLLVYPLGLTWILIAAAFFLHRHRRWQRAVLILALALIFIAGNSYSATALVRSLEWRILPPDEIAPAEAKEYLGIFYYQLQGWL